MLQLLDHLGLMLMDGKDCAPASDELCSTIPSLPGDCVLHSFLLILDVGS